MTRTDRRSYRPRAEQLEDRLVPAVVPNGFADVPFASGLTQPTAMEFAPDGRIFVSEQGGAVRVIKNGALLPTPFLTVTVNSQGERGLLGITLDPDFNTNKFVYIYYTATTPQIHNRVSRFTANGDTVVPGSEVPLLNLENLSATNHNGGALHFGPDGKLYVAVGENAVASNAQSLGNRLGKILRINKDGSIPGDNPTSFSNIAGSPTGDNRAIWAVGLRNPFTFAFQPGTNRMFINDVGASSFEEINDGVAGGNYGWPIYEGLSNPPDPRFLDPFFTYAQSTNEAGITGGVFYNPAAANFPADFIGDYFFADLGAGFIRRIDTAAKTVSPFATGVSVPVDLDVGPDGALYYLAYGSGQIGQVRFVASPQPNPASSTLGVFDPSAAAWYLRNTNSPGAPDATPFAYGAPGAAPVAGDWDGNGVQTVGVYGPGSALWQLRNSNGPGVPDAGAFAYGDPAWLPVAGDWDNDGKDSIGVFDPSTATWYLRNSLSAGAPSFTPFAYGGRGWIPVVGDWDGNGTFTVGIFDPATATFYLRNSNTPAAPDAGVINFGGPGWTPVAGDWNGDGSTTIGVVDPARNWYLKNSNTPGAPDIGPFAYGAAGWRPVPGDKLAGLGVSGGPGMGADAVTAAEVSALAAALGSPPDVTFEVRDLGGNWLGMALASERRVVIDDDAAGHGWFLDPTPLLNEEFLDSTSSSLSARPGGPASGRVDLVTALRHELGHLTGLEDLDARADALMAGALPPGVRRV